MSPPRSQSQSSPVSGQVASAVGPSTAVSYTRALTLDLERVKFARLNNFHLFNKVRRTDGRFLLLLLANSLCVETGTFDFCSVPPLGHHFELQWRRNLLLDE